jgi:hypothetical protein
MRKLVSNLGSLSFSDRSVPWLLLLVAVVSYGLLLPQMGFYWDELPMTWIRYELGTAAMTRYFSTNRPVWGLLYQVTTRVLPQIPIYWQIFCLFWRWLSAVLVWGIVRRLWPGQRQMPVIAGLCFLLYPGFSQQWTSYLYGHFFVVLCFLLFSFLCTLWSVRYATRYLQFTILGMIFSALNLWMMEYFYVLELFRPFLLFRIVAVESRDAVKRRLGRTFLLWLPYLLIFIANVLWRLFVFNNQVYQPSLIPQLKVSPIATLTNLVGTVLGDIYTVSLAAWGQIFRFPNPIVDGPRTTVFYVAVVVLTALIAGLFLIGTREQTGGQAGVGWWAMGLGTAAMLVAGGPFWLTRLDVTLAFPANRFTLPFMLGVAVFLAGLLELAPAKIRIGLAVCLVGLAAGRQALLADSYRRDWATQKALFWQMYWRAPGLTPNTMILLNEGALSYYADNSLTAALNWIYDPDNRSNAMEYAVFYPTSRLGGTLQGFAPGQSITYDFISEVFTGNTSQTVAFYYQPPGCLRLLDPQIDSQNHLVSDASRMREAAALSSSTWVLPAATARMPQTYGTEPVHGWCYYFEKAELAAQLRDWSQVVQLGDQAFSLSDYPNDPVERFVFAEGYANTGNWARARDLSVTSYKVSKAYVGPLLCRLWQRIELETTASPQRTAALAEVKRLFACTSE